MGRTDKGQAIVVVESFGNVLTESVARSTRRDAPTAPVVRVGPEQVAHRPFVRDLLDAVDGSNVVKRVDGWRQAAV